MLVVHGFPSLGPQLTSPSPFCLKLECWLHLAGIPFEARGDYNPFAAPKGKAPYITTEDGRVLADSSHIIETLTAEHGVQLDAHLDPEAMARALLLQRTIEDHLYFCLLHDRWIRDEGFAILRRAYFVTMPWPMRVILPLVARRKVRASNFGQGTSRHSDAQVWAAAIADLDAVAILLGDDAYFGGEQPATIDAIVYGALANIAFGPFPGPLQEALARHPNLLAWLERVFARTFGAAAAGAAA
ncbi:MAG: glutathione S-transferase family protein [Deltaproteobacteria bacterium]|nr:glutathione S-transferase family protein [Deltaproteobacteria bacterium]